MIIHIRRFLFRRSGCRARSSDHDDESRSRVFLLSMELLRADRFHREFSLADVLASVSSTDKDEILWTHCFDFLEGIPEKNAYFM